MEDRIEERLEKAAVLIVPDEAAKERILESVKEKKVSRKRLSVRVPAAVLAACVMVCLLWFGGVQSLLGEKVVVYAATEDHGWQKLKEGERILLKKEPYQMIEEGEEIEPFDEFEWHYYYPYKCIFRVEVPDNYRYAQQAVLLRDDFISTPAKSMDLIEWHVAPDRPEDAGRVMQGSCRIWIVNDKLERVGAYDLKLTKEDGKCYAELVHVWGKWGK